MKTFATAAAATMALLVTTAAHASVTVASFAQGWVNSAGSANGAMDGNNTFTGNEYGNRYNSWAAFFIPVGTYSAASLDLVSTIYANPDPGVDRIEFHDVTTAYSAFSSATGGAAAYADLMNGSLYGFANLYNTTTSVALGGNIVSDINAAAGQIFVIGFTNATLNLQDPNGVDSGIYTNGGYGGGSAPTLQLTSGAAVPEPATWAMMITGFGLAGATLRRRRTVAAAA
jgi:hypothetical protein